MMNNIKPLKIDWGTAKRPTIFEVAQKTGANCQASSTYQAHQHTQEGVKVPTTDQAHNHLTQEGVKIPPTKIPQKTNPPTKMPLPKNCGTTLMIIWML
jgi:hypothetical protein